MLAGAPESGTLDWTAQGLLDVFDTRHRRFLQSSAGVNLPTTQDESVLKTGQAQLAAWRSLPLERQHLTTGHSQIHGYNISIEDDEETSFLSTADLSIAEAHSSEGSDKQIESLRESINTASSQDPVSQFYNHSFALHEALPSSQIPAASLYSNSSTTTTSTSSHHQASQPVLTPPAPTPALIPGHLSDLEDLPSAKYITKIHPQTITVNLIVGIISVSPPRPITTRFNTTVNLISLIVGDETRAGFEINFWLPQLGLNAVGGAGKRLQTLRGQDVLLLRNVALSSFRGRVFGQSLRKGMTSFEILFRRRLGSADGRVGYDEKILRDASLAMGRMSVAENQDHSIHPQILKTARVWDWVQRFVGGPVLRIPDVVAGPAVENGGARDNEAQLPASGSRKSKRVAAGVVTERAVTRNLARVKGMLPPDTQ